MKTFQLLVVDDELTVHETLKQILPPSWNLLSVHNPEALPPQGYQAAFVDIHLSDQKHRQEGFGVMKALRDKNPNMEIVAFSSDLQRDTMEKALKAGATRFLAKPVHPEEFLLVLQKIEALLLLQRAHFGQGSPIAFLGQSPALLDVKKKVALLCQEDGPILIEGESGTGKEVVARWLNQQDGREPFITLNIASVPENLFESEFFGHVKGAFTGAEQNKMGLAEASHGGDLFLDEIEALSLPLQAKLLRFLENGEVRRVGAKDTVIVKSRILSATNRSLEDMVKEKSFREDLLYRLSGKKVRIPPLRERTEDIPLLAKYFLEKDRVRKKTLTAEASEVMQAYSWPGNVRELKRFCEQLCLVAPLPLIREEDVKLLLSPTAGTSNSGTQNYDLQLGLIKLLENEEKKMIEQALKQISDIDEAARALQISRSSLYKKIKDYNISWRDQ